MQNLIKAAAAVALIPLASCATIFNGSTTDVEITSVPPGAAFTSDHGGVSGTTPMTVTLGNGKKPVHYTFTMDGYNSLLHSDKGSLSGWVIGNVIFGGIIGIVIDVVGSNAYSHHDIEAVMVPVGGFPEPEPQDIQIAAKPESNWSRRPDDR